jgi:hypothetical protein
MEDSEKFYVEQRIKLNAEVVRILHLTLLATLGGTLTLVLTRAEEERRSVLIFFGLSVSIFCLISTIIVLINSDRLIKKLRKNE